MSPRREASRAIPTWCSASTTCAARRSRRSSPTPRTARWRGSTRAWPGELLIVTQNVDDLHERAGAQRVLHMHGEDLNAWCTACDARRRWTGPLLDAPAMPGVRRAGAAARRRLVRRDAVPDGRDLRRAARAPTCSCRSAPRARSIPAAGFVRERARARRAHARAQPRAQPGLALVRRDARLGPAGELVPAWVEEVLEAGCVGG